MASGRELMGGNIAPGKPPPAYMTGFDPNAPIGEEMPTAAGGAAPAPVPGGLPEFPTGGEQDAPAPIGVPEGYTATLPRTGTNRRYGLTRDVPPRYFDGMELDPQNWGAPRIADLQRQLVEAGLLKKNGFKLGFWDAASIDAYGNLLAAANRSGMTAEATLTRIKTADDALGPEYAGYGADATDTDRAPMVLNITNPADLKALLGDVSGRVIGRKLTDAESAQFVATYQQMERDAGRRNYEVTNPEGPGGESIDAQAPQPLAEDYVRKNFANEAITHGALDRFNQFMDLI